MKKMNQTTSARYILHLFILFILILITYYSTCQSRIKNVNKGNVQLLVQTKTENNVQITEQVNINGLPQDDPRLIAEIRRRFLIQPSPDDVPYALKEPFIEDTSLGQSAAIRDILKDQTNGFFIECGALNGESLSNTLYLEKTRGWKGLLIEADPYSVPEILKRRRHAWVAPVCLSLSTVPDMVRFHPVFGAPAAKGNGRIMDVNEPDHPDQVYIQCIPIFSLLLALNQTTIDFFSLDVEGVEFEVLETIPFDKINIKTLAVEYAHVKRGPENLRKFMEDKGYKMVKTINVAGPLAEDFIFAKNELVA